MKGISTRSESVLTPGAVKAPFISTPLNLDTNCTVEPIQVQHFVSWDSQFHGDLMLPMSGWLYKSMPGDTNYSVVYIRFERDY